MLSTIHILLTYKCPLKCGHCFVFGGPRREGQLNYTQVNQLLVQAIQAKAIEWIIFGGGEPFLYYPLLLKSIKKARGLGFKVGVFTNGFFARTDAAATRYLRPLVDLGLDKIFISSDRLHYNKHGDTPALRAGRAALRLGIPVSIESVQILSEQESPPIRDFDPACWHKNDLMMAGRAVDNLASRYPRSDPEKFTSCPENSISKPERVYIDVSGNVQVCPGLSIGNVWRSSLQDIMDRYNPDDHPICGHLSTGGPLLLSRLFAYDLENGFVDSCHLCFMTRRFLIDRFPLYLAPRHVYGTF